MIEEYIKRKDALDVFSKHMFAGYRGNGKSFFSEIVMPTFYCAIEDLPAADVRENIHGKWIDEYYTCSECGEDVSHIVDGYFAIGFDGCNFCPNCGADMRGI